MKSANSSILNVFKWKSFVADSYEVRISSLLSLIEVYIIVTLESVNLVSRIISFYLNTFITTFENTLGIISVWEKFNFQNNLNFQHVSYTTVSAECRWGAPGKSDKYMGTYTQKSTIHYSVEGTMWEQWRWDKCNNKVEAHLSVKNQDSVSVKAPQERMRIHNNSTKLIKLN